MSLNVHDHAKFQNKYMFVHSIVGFIFYLQRKNKQLEIAAISKHIFSGKLNAVFFLFDL
jgi:hypothetical protein